MGLERVGQWAARAAGVMARPVTSRMDAELCEALIGQAGDDVKKYY